MASVTAKCTQCGENIEIDDSKEAGICPHCGSAFVTEKAISNFNVNNHNNINAHNLTANNQTKLNNIENLIINADRAYISGSYDEAYSIYMQILSIEPNNWRAIYRKGISKSYTTTLGLFDLQSAYSGVLTAHNIIKTADVDRLSANLEMSGELAKIGTNFNRWAYQSYQEACNMGTLILGTGELDKLKQRQKQCMKMYLLGEQILREFPEAKVARIEALKCVIDFTKSETSMRDLYNEAGAMLETIDETYHHSNQGCYIATCVYGSYDCPQVWTLRRYRDFKLSKTWLGRAFIKFYYIISPLLVKLFGCKSWFRKFWKKRLDKKVTKLQKNGVASTPYNDIDW